MIRSFLIALQFLTRLPVNFTACPDATDTAGSLPFYPLVGLIIGALLLCGAWLGASLEPPLLAAILLCAWVVLSGGMHIDGLADSADAWAGGRGNRDRMLAIMKDPCIGPLGMTAVLLVLILKFAALFVLLKHQQIVWLLAAPLLARAALPLLFATTAYVRPEGLGSALANGMSRPATWISVSIACMILLLLAGLAGLLAIASALAAFIVLRSFMCRQLGGTTGDTAGALVELTETLVLVVMAAVPVL